MEASQPPSMPAFAAIIEAALRLHPAQSAAEDALLQFPSLDGIGLALQVSDGQIDTTAILSLNANYPAPTLTTATAGTALLSLIPGDSFVVLDSYDLSVTTLPLAALTYLGPAIGNIFTNIVTDLNSGALLPTPTPTPSPTPAPPLTADAIIAQVQPHPRASPIDNGLVSRPALQPDRRRICARRLPRCRPDRWRQRSTCKAAIRKRSSTRLITSPS